MEESENKAIGMLRQGNIDGLETLVEFHYLKAVRAAYLITRELSMAEDIVQSAFVKTFERIAQFREGSEFRPWFLRSVINDALMAMRHAGYTSSLSETWDIAVSLPDVEASLDEMLIAQETNETIWEALGNLTPRQRTAIVMHYYLDMSEAEIAASLECPQGTVKSRLHSARQRLRQLLPVALAPSTPSIAPVEKKS